MLINEKLLNKYQENNLGIQIVKNPADILKYLQIGTIIPIWEEFNEYILHDIKFFNAKSWLIKEKGNICGHLLVYNYKEILYFGFLNIINHDVNKIQYVIRKLVKYAKNNKFKSIKGPINIPTILFGWGFMEKGSIENLFLAKPINPSIYQEIFIKNGFYIASKQYSYEGKIPEILDEELDKYEFNDYQLIFLKNLKDINHQNTFKKLIIENLSNKSVITPANIYLFNNYLTFAHKYAKPALFVFIKYKITNEIIGCLACLNNPFRKNQNGLYDSFTIFIDVINKKHRGKGLNFLIHKKIFDKAINNGMKYLSSLTESNRNVFIGIMEKFNLRRKRIHNILEYEL